MHGECCDIGVRNFDALQQARSSIIIPIVKHQQAAVDRGEYACVGVRVPRAPGAINEANCRLNGVVSQRETDVVKLAGKLAADTTPEVRS